MLQKMALSVFLGVCKTSVISTIVDLEVKTNDDKSVRPQ